MIPLISNILMLLIACFAFLHYGSNRNAVLIVICGWLIFGLIDPYVRHDGLLYFSVAALIDLAIIEILCRIIKQNDLISDLINVCFVFIYLNLFGWITYMQYIDVGFYNLLCAVSYLAALMITINNGKGERNVLGNCRLVDGGFSFRFNHRASYSVNQKTKKAKDS